MSGWVLRTGFSPGADQAFYNGARAAGGPIELHLPWPGFEEDKRDTMDGVRVCGELVQEAYDIASRFHPQWDALELSERHLRARDVQLILGEGFDEPVQIVICWTPDGSLDGSSPLAGGTGQGLRLAHHHGIPVLNLARPEHLRRALALPPSSSPQALPPPA